MTEQQQPAVGASCPGRPALTDNVLVLAADPDLPVPLVPADPPAPVRIDQLPAEVRALLAAVVDALDVPLADTAEDHRVRAGLLDARASDARIILAAVIRGDLIADCARQLLGWTAARPASYQVYEAAARDGGQQ